MHTYNDPNSIAIDVYCAGGWPFYQHCSPPAPWDEHSPIKRRQFWESRDSWFSSWQQPFSIDYIRVYQ